MLERSKHHKIVQYPIGQAISKKQMIDLLLGGVWEKGSILPGILKLLSFFRLRDSGSVFIYAIVPRER
jgi:hypothetical protein